jgi:hypothetical protein
MANPSEGESNSSKEFSSKKVFEGEGHLVYTDDGVFLVPDSQLQEPSYFDRPILDKKISMFELFEDVNGQFEYRITVEYRLINPESR